MSYNQFRIPIRLGDGTVRLLPLGADGVVDTRPTWVQNQEVVYVDDAKSALANVHGEAGKIIAQQAETITKLKGQLDNVREKLEVARRDHREAENRLSSIRNVLGYRPEYVEAKNSGIDID